MSGLLKATRAPWYATPVVAVAVLLGFNGLDSMIVWGPWLTTAIALTAFVTVAISVTRMVSRSRTLPTMIGFVAAVVASVPAFARGPEGQVRYLPTPTGLRELVAAVGDGIHDAATTVPPAEMTRPLVALVMCGALAIFLLADHLAVSWRAAAFSGLILLAPWMPAIALQHRISVRMLLAAIGCWVVLLALTKRPTGAAPRPSIGAAVMAAGATVALVALVTPTALGGNGWGFIPRIDTPSQFETTSRLNLELDLRNSLTANSASVIMAYVTNGKRPEAFRLYTLTDFDGNTWSVDNSETAQQPLTGVLWGGPVVDWDARPHDRVVISVQDYVDSHLFLPTVPRSVNAPGSWTYSPEQDVVSSTTDKTQGLEYSFDADLDYLDADALRALGDASSEDALFGPEYLDIPIDADRDRFTSLAQEVTAEAPSRYDQAVAIQEYFRDASQFTYDTAVNPSGDDSVSVFLDDQSGYCVQFATGMVMLARSLNIPARLAIGFLPGTPNSDGGVVHGGDAHAWPELYFSQTGWVRFEPTPAVQTGPRPSYADPTSQVSPVEESEAPVPGEVPSSAPRPDTGDVNGPSTQAPATGGSIPWAAILAVVLAVAVALGGAALWMRRKLAHDHDVTTPETIWARLGERLPLEITWRPPLTPKECVDHVVRELALEGTTLSDETIDQFAGLSRAVADYRYAPDGTTADVESLTQTADAVASGITMARGTDAKSRRARGGGRDDSRHGG